MRILINQQSKKRLFNFLKEKYKVKSLKELSKKINIPFKTLSNWEYGRGYLPDKIVYTEIITESDIIDKQPDNWGAVKAGKIGGKKSKEILKRIFGEEKHVKMRKEIGKKAINTLWKKYGIKELTKMTVAGKIKKRENESKMLEKENENYFTNEEISLNCKEVNYAPGDIKKGIKFPNKITPELAEEIGVHLGDGCLSKNRNYLSCIKIFII